MTKLKSSKIVTVVSVLRVTIVIVILVLVTVVTIAVLTVVIVTYFSKNNLTPPKPMRFLKAAFHDLAMFLDALPSLVLMIVNDLLINQLEIVSSLLPRFSSLRLRFD